MVKSELVQKLCNMHPNIFRRDIEKMVQIIVCEMVEALKRDEAIEIRGWGRIKTVVRKARAGRNPKNSESIQIPEKKAIKWKMSKTLFNQLNNNSNEKKVSSTF